MKKHIYIAVLIIYFITLPKITYAGDSLKAICENENRTYVSEQYINAVTIVNRWKTAKYSDYSQFGALQVKIGNTYYGISVSTTPDHDGLMLKQYLDMANLAYLYRKRVNACVGDGYLRGLELGEQ